MIPFEPWASHVWWYQRWRSHIASAKSKPEECNGYCRAAAIAQAFYVMHLAIDKVKYYQ